MSSRAGTPHLVCKVATVTCAVPIAHVVETMRPLPIEPLRGAPEYVLGMSVIRGEPTPVIDGGSLIAGQRQSRPTRFVTLAAGERRVAFAVDAVLGVHALAPDTTARLPQLLERTHGDLIAAIAADDAELLLVLRATSLVPESVWKTLDQQGEG